MSVDECLRLSLEYCDILRCYKNRQYNQLTKKLQTYPNKETVNNLLVLFKKEENVLGKFKNLETSNPDNFERIIEGYLEDGNKIQIVFYHFDDQITKPLLINKNLLIKLKYAKAGRWVPNGAFFGDCAVKTKNTKWVNCEITILEKSYSNTFSILEKYNKSTPNDIYSVKSSYPESIERKIRLFKELGLSIDKEVERLLDSGHDLETIVEYSLGKVKINM